MMRTTITLPDELAQAAQREARRRQTSVSEVAREALAAHLGFGPNSRVPFANLGRSGDGNIAARIEEILAEEWHPDRDR